MASQYQILVFTIPFGLIIGSFLNLVIYRLPLMLQFAYHRECLDFILQNNLHHFLPNKSIKTPTFNLCFPSSHCPFCKITLSWWQNIPIVSFFLLRGRCYNCNTKISRRYLLVECLTAIITSYIVAQHGLGIQTAALLLFTWSLIALTFIDLETLLLPDTITLNLLWLGLLLNVSNYRLIATANSVLGAIAGYLSLYGITWIFKLVRGCNGMGNGDFKLFATLGAWCGWQALPVLLLFACLSGLLFGFADFLWKKFYNTKKQNVFLKTAIPFGPHLALAGWVIIITNN